MNRLRKALSMDRVDSNAVLKEKVITLTSSASDTRKKRFSLFNGKTSNKRNSDDLPQLSIGAPCVAYPPELKSAIEIGNQHSDSTLYRTRSAHMLLDNHSSASYSSSSSSYAANSMSENHLSHNNQSLQSLNSVDMIPPAVPQRRSMKLSTTSNSIAETSQNATDHDRKSIQETDYLQLGMKYHEKGELEKATHYWRLSAETGSPLGLFFYGIALRHGWGCKKNSAKAVRYLQSAAESAVHDLQTGIAQSASVAKSELVLAIYELGVCFRHGWGVPKNLETAAYYFQVASNLGDPDAQNDLGFCYSHGLGVKKDLYAAAKYYRLAEKQGQGQIGNSWIWKEKYNQVEEPGWKGKVKK